MLNTGLVQLAWLDSKGQLIQAGMGFMQDGHLMAVWSTVPTYGFNFYKILPNGTLEARWSSVGINGKVLAEIATGGTPGKLEGNYNVRGEANTAEGGTYTGTMRIDRYGDTYYVGWNVGGKPFHGIGLRQGD